MFFTLSYSLWLVTAIGKLQHFPKTLASLVWQTIISACFGEKDGNRQERSGSCRTGCYAHGARGQRRKVFRVLLQDFRDLLTMLPNQRWSLLNLLQNAANYLPIFRRGPIPQFTINLQLEQIIEIFLETLQIKRANP